MDRKALNLQAIQAASDLRDQLDFDQFGPVDSYHAAELLGIKVVFLDSSMEGFYFRQTPARILLSSLRPVARRAFTCAHEVGHHIFGHGSTIDQLQEDDRADSGKPNEVLANAFAAFFLMPSVGLRGAFSRRGWTCEAATPIQMYTIACQFGVGYVTLLNHLSYTLGELSAARRKELGRWTPQRIRQELLEEEYDALTLVDEHNEAVSFDLEKEAAILLPIGTEVSGDALQFVRSLEDFALYQAVKRGRSKVSGVQIPFEVRVMPKEYVGAAANRFVEDPDED
jgi:Zn-dependent peptidase ImmA (M78 family)